MSEMWSFRGGLLGALLGLAIALVVILVRHPTPEISDAVTPPPFNPPNSPTGQGGPPLNPVSGGGSGGYYPSDFGPGYAGINGSLLSRIADMQIRLGQTKEAVETISAASSPFEIVNFLKRFRAASTESPSSGFVPRIRGAPTPITPDSFNEALRPRSDDQVPNKVLSQPQKDFVLNVLDRLDQRLKRLPALPVGDDVPTQAGGRPETALGPEPVLAIQEHTQEQSELLVAMAELYQGIDEAERAKKLLAEAQREVVAFQKAAIARDLQRPVMSAAALSVPSQMSFPNAKAETQDRKTSNWGWIFTTLTTVLGTILGGVFKPVLEAYGKGVVGKAFAEAIQSQEFAAALDLKHKQSTPSRSDDIKADQPKQV